MDAQLIDLGFLIHFRCDFHLQHLAVPVHRQCNRAWIQVDELGEIVLILNNLVMPSVGHFGQFVPGLQSGTFCRRAGNHIADFRLGHRHDALAQADAHIYKRSQKKVHGHPCQQDNDLLPGFFIVQKFIGPQIFLPVRLVFFLFFRTLTGFSGHHAIAAERYGPKGPLCLLPLFFPQKRSHPQRELVHVDAKRPGRQIMAIFMDHHNDRQHHHKSDQSPDKIHTDPLYPKKSGLSQQLEQNAEQNDIV